MSANPVILGTGDATGMLYHAPENTALPASAVTAPGSAWTLVGDVDHDGITLALNKTTETLKNWANKVKRVIMTDHDETIQCGIMDTTEETLEAVFGDDNVTVTPADTTHGKQLSVDLSADNLPDPEAWLFVLKDGDTMVMIGTTSGQVSAVENVDMKPDGAITWKPTITAVDGWTLMTDDGDKTA